MSETGYAEAESAFRNGLRSSRPFAAVPKVNWALLSDEEFEAGSRYLRGCTNDDSVLRRAAERQGGGK
jgi:hypothetical protein